MIDDDDDFDECSGDIAEHVVDEDLMNFRLESSMEEMYALFLMTMSFFKYLIL